MRCRIWSYRGVIMNHEEIILRAQEYIANETDPSFSEEIKELLQKGDWKELEDRFYRDLEFGTGGLRGIMGVGTLFNLVL